MSHIGLKFLYSVSSEQIHGVGGDADYVAQKASRRWSERSSADPRPRAPAWWPALRTPSQNSDMAPISAPDRQCRPVIVRPSGSEARLVERRETVLRINDLTDPDLD